MNLFSKQQLGSVEANINMMYEQRLAYMAHMIAESDNFTRMEENLYYTTVARIKAVFPRLQEAEKLVRKPQQLANAAYNGRMGNRLNSDDGWNYRGSGYIQLTGRDNFEDFAIWLKPLELNINSSSEIAELTRKDRTMAYAAALYFFDRNLRDAATLHDMFKRINPAMARNKTEVAKRERIYADVCKHFIYPKQALWAMVTDYEEKLDG